MTDQMPDVPQAGGCSLTGFVLGCVGHGVIGAYLGGVVSWVLGWDFSSGMWVGLWSGLGLFTFLTAQAVLVAALDFPVEEESRPGA